MPGIPACIAKHNLDVRKDARPVKQALRRFAMEKSRTIGEEITQLPTVGFIREVAHPKRLVSPMMVRKNDSWCMCVDNTDLNKAFPKDLFLLPHINQVIKRCLLPLPSNPDEGIRSGKNVFYYTFRA